MKLVAILVLLLGMAPVSEARRRVRVVRRVVSEYKEANQLLRSSLPAVRRACGLPKLRVEMDWPSFKGQANDSAARRNAAGLCETVVDGLKRWCEERESKGGLSQQLTTVHCGYRREALRFQAEKRGSEVWVRYSWETANLAEETVAWLRKEF